MPVVFPQFRKILLIKPVAWLRVSALKKIQAKVTNVKVPSISKSSFPDGNLASLATISWLYFLLRLVRSSGKKAQACKKPQIMKFQLAPCQKPLTKKMIKVLRMALF